MNEIANALYIKKRICDGVVAEQARICSELMAEGRLNEKQVKALVDADEKWLEATKAALG